MGASTAPAVKAALLTGIKALPEAAAENWDVDWGFARTPERTWVYCGEISWDSSAWVTNLRREEIYNVQLVVNIKRRRGTPQDVENECMRVMGLIEAWLNTDTRLGGIVVLAELVPKRMDSWPSDDFTEAQYEASVQITARF